MASYRDYLLQNLPVLRRTMAQPVVPMPPAQSQMSNAQLVSRGPGYGSQAARVAATQRPRQLAPVQETPGVQVPQSVVDTLPGASPEVVPSQPNIVSQVANVVTNPGQTANQVAQFGIENTLVKPVSFAAQHVPYGDKALDLLNKAYEWNTGRVGGDMYQVAIGGKSPADWPIYNVDNHAAIWSADAANAPRIKAVFENGLDLNGDGQIDLKGGDAVYAMYVAEEHSGFIDQMITAMGMDPLFYVSVVGPAAGAVKEGAAVGAEAATIGGAAKQAAIFKAIEKAAGGITKAGDAGNFIADAPFTIPAAALRKGAGLAQPGGRVGRTIGWLTADAGPTVEKKVLNTATDTADSALMASAIPSQGTGLPYGTGPANVQMTPYALPERSVTNPAEFVGTPYGVASTADPRSYPDLATPAIAAKSQYPDFTVGPGGDVTPNVSTQSLSGPYTGSGVPVEQDAAPVVNTTRPPAQPREIPIHRSNAQGKPTTFVGVDGDVKVVARDSGVFEVQTKQQYGKTGKLKRWNPEKGFQDEAQAIEHAKQLVRQKMPQEKPRTLPTATMTRDEINAAIQDPNNPITQLTPIPGGTRIIDKAWDAGDLNPAGWDAFNADYTPKAKAFLERANYVEGKYYDDFNHKVADQSIGGIEHAIDEVVPSYLKAYGEMPDLSPNPALRKVAETKSGKASYRDENLPYLYERYVFTESEKDAARIMETIRARGELANAPWSEDALARLVEVRDRLKAMVPDLGGGSPLGIVSPGSQQLWAIQDRVDRMVNALLGNPEQQAARVPNAPDFKADDLGAAERFTLANELAIQVARGELPEAAASELAKTIRSTKMKMTKTGKPSKFGTWRDASPQEAQVWATANKVEIPANGNFARDVIQIRETSQLDLLTQIVKENPSATAGEISDLFANRVADMTGSRVQRRPPMRKPIEAVRRFLGGIHSSGRSIALNNPLSTVRGSLSDLLSDNLRATYEGHLGAAIKSTAPNDYINMMRGVESELDRALSAYGLDKPQDLKVKQGRTEIAAEGRTATNKAVSGMFGFEQGGKADRVTGILTGTLDNRTGRDIRAANDNVRREAVMLSEIEKRETAMARAFRERSRTLAERHGILPSSMDAYLGDLGQRFTVGDLETAMKELARDAQLPSDQAVNFVDRMKRSWKHATSEMIKKADAEQKRVFFTYERTKLDELLGNFIFYHYWMTRAVPAYIKIALKNPEIAASWVRAWEEVGRRAEADGQPDSLQGYIRAMGSMSGFYGSVNPWNLILPIADLRPDLQSQGRWDQVSQFVFVSPVIQAAVSALGGDSSVVDPLNLYATRSMGMAILNDVRAHTGRTPITTDLYEQALRTGFELVNEGLSTFGLAREQDFLDPAVFTQSTIRAVVASVVEAQTGIPKEQWGPDEWEVWRSAVADGESGIVNPIYQEAFQQWADANLKGRVLNSFVPGGFRTRYGPKDALQAGDLTDEEKIVKGRMNAGSMQDAGLDILDQQYRELGSDRQRAFADGYNAIVSDDPIDGMDNGQVIEIGGQYFTKTQLLELNKDDRFDLANAWVAQHGGTEEYEAYKAKREQFVADHPEYGDFTEYRTGVYRYKGGPRQYRLDRAQGNPNFKAEMEKRRDYLLSIGTDPSVIEDELDDWAANLDGYKAAQGIKNYLYDTAPKSTGDQATVDTILRSMDGGGNGGSSSSSTPKTTASKLKADIKKYEDGLAVVEGLMKDYGIDPSLLTSYSPYAQETLDSLFGDLMPYKSTFMKQYEQWASLQPAGTDTSPEAFAQWFDNLNQDEAA